MLQTLTACLTVAGLLLAFTTDDFRLTLAGLLLLAVSGGIVMRHPEWLEG